MWEINPTLSKQSSVGSIGFLCLVPVIEISQDRLSVTCFHQKAIIAILSKSVSADCYTHSQRLKRSMMNFKFAYCGMNQSNTLYPALILVYSLSFIHHHHPYFIINTLSSNEK